MVARALVIPTNVCYCRGIIVEAYADRRSGKHINMLLSSTPTILGEIATYCKKIITSRKQFEKFQMQHEFCIAHRIKVQTLFQFREIAIHCYKIRKIGPANFPMMQIECLQLPNINMITCKLFRQGIGGNV